VISSKANEKNPPAFFPKALYRALRGEKTARHFGSFVALALGFINIKTVHRT
jgi:hypothetical protein